MSLEKQIAAIPTEFQGTLYKSRLEARWAIFMTEMEMEFHYEMESFDLGKHGKYTPDFWLPQVNSWVEVKPTAVNDAYMDKLVALVAGTSHALILLVGPPALVGYEQITAADEDAGEQLCQLIIFDGQDGSGYYRSERRFYTDCEPILEDWMVSDKYLQAIETASKWRFDLR